MNHTPIYQVTYDPEVFDSELGLPNWIFIHPYLDKYLTDYPSKILHEEESHIFLAVTNIFLFKKDFTNGDNPVINKLTFNNPFSRGLIRVEEIQIPHSRVSKFHDGIFYVLEAYDFEYDLEHLNQLLHQKHNANIKRNSRFRRRAK